MLLTQYARNGSIEIAYQVLGEGPLDLVFIEGNITHLDLYWELPAYRRFCESLASFTRLIRIDKRGMGLSDRTRIGTLEERMEDVRAVMDALGSDKAAFLGESEGGPLSIVFAASYPERTHSLILCGAEICERKDKEWPWGEATPEDFEVYVKERPKHWAAASKSIYRIAPSVASEETQRWWDRMRTHAITPSAAVDFMRMAFDIDVRDVLPAIRVPTLILHRTGDNVCHVENGRYAAAHIPGAKYVELPGADHVPWSGDDQMLDEIREFLTGVREPAVPDRVLATVLFVDAVDSTKLASSVGDRKWRELLAFHQQTVRREVERFRGREIDSAGDGMLAAFDGPARAIRCAQSIVRAVQSSKLRIRAGLHTGECEVIGDKLAGIAVHIGARVAAKAARDEVLVTSTVRDLVAGAGIEFEDRGTHELKGIDGEWRLFAVK